MREIALGDENCTETGMEEINDLPPMVGNEGKGRSTT
jgi:hypothetical protein